MSEGEFFMGGTERADVRPLRNCAVSLVINTFEDVRFLPDAIQSALAQTRPFHEILLVDDGSSTDPAPILEPYPSVRLIRRANGGLAAARNTGLEEAASPYIIFLDADDRLDRHAVEAGLACIEATPGAAMVYGAHRRVDAGGQPIGPDRYEEISPDPHADFLRKNMVGMHAAVLYRTEALRALGGFESDLRLGEDYDLYLSLSRKAQVGSHPGIVAEYRWHDGNISRDRIKMLRSVLTVHGRYRPSWPSQHLAAWHEGRRNWRNYYAAELAQAGLAEWRTSRNHFATLRGLLDATRASPRWAARQGLSLVAKAMGSGSPPRLGTVRMGDFSGTRPVSMDFGWDRGQPVDRHYIEAFLDVHREDIHGRVLEIGDDAYSRRYGGERVQLQDILHVHAGNPVATISGDLAVPGVLPPDSFDCIVLTQTLHLVYDAAAAVSHIHAALRPGGVLLLTVPGISQLDRGEWSRCWYWSFTPASVRRMFSAMFGEDSVQIRQYGNVYAATSFLQGLAVEEIDRAKLDVVDTAYPVIVAARAVKRPVP